jgi:hypothetical protein
MTLEAYRDLFLLLPMKSLKVIECRNFGVLVASVVHREPPFQVELVMGMPGQHVPAHRHPHIDAYEVHISGDLRVVVGETPEITNAKLETAKVIPERWARGKSFFIAHTDWHAAKVGDKGAAFWSIQQWTGPVPLTAAGIDWEGGAM